MISVLIPVYRYPVTRLVYDLDKQLKTLGIPYEIRLLDDGSPENERHENRTLNQLNSVKYSELPHNIGRASIRNRLAKEAQYEWLWFLDCDSGVGENQQLAQVFWETKIESGLVSGGRIYNREKPSDKAYILHWKWGAFRELIQPETRMKDPVNHFLSNNFFIPKELLLTSPFNEKLKGYGYEDTLFAYALQKQGFQIKHIYNPVVHEGLDKQLEFIGKIEESLHNLLKLELLAKEDNIENPIKSKLYSTLIRIRSFRCIWLFKMLSKPILKLAKRKILKPEPNLFWFDIYRIFYLIAISR
jgi:glycosyltransferase involved in cell wall biosynthesis